jgi:hypothetical protein
MQYSKLQQKLVQNATKKKSARYTVRVSNVHTERATWYRSHDDFSFFLLHIVQVSYTSSFA